jgi:hypothetical protein
MPKTRSVKYGGGTRSVKHVNVFGIITKTTKCLNIEINTENVTTYALAKLHKKTIDIRKKK